MSNFRQTAAAARPQARPMKPLAKPIKAGGQSTEGQPFDPDELSRRLIAVIAEQKAFSRRTKHHRPRPPPLPETWEEDPLVPELGVEAPIRQTAVPLALRAATSPFDTRRSNFKATASGLRPRANSNSNVSDEERAAVCKPDEANSSKSDLEAEDQCSSYRHVPQEAARQFARTTTVVGMRDGTGLANKFSKQALKLHIAVRRSVAPGKGPASPSADAPPWLRKSKNRRETMSDRAQLAHSRMVNENLTVEEEPVPEVPQQYTFEGELGAFKQELQKGPQRRSAGEMLEPDGANRSSFVMEPGTELDDLAPLAPLTPLPPPDPPVPARDRIKGNDHHRIDWTQSDEVPTTKPRITLLRRPDSLLALRVRMGGSASAGRKHSEESAETPGDRPSTAPLLDAPKSAKTKTFFSKFRR